MHGVGQLSAAGRDDFEEVAALRAQLEAAESTVRDQRAQLHEVGSTVAGIISAVRLVNAPTVALPAQRRSLLEQMIEAEMSRLEKLMLGESDAERVFDVDDVLQQLVVLQHAQGRPVSWEPSGCVAYGCPDDLAEAVHVLLNNAALHGGSAEVMVRAREVEGVVKIEVSDSGPGIPRDLRSHVFGWGRRGRESSGQGIGLSVARDLVERQGGSLVLEDSRHPGATFTVGLRSGVSHDRVNQYAS